MARIEFADVEQKMEDLRGYCKTTLDDDKNPYKADELNDDEFNFISGMNYVLSYVTDNFLANREVDGYCELESLEKLLKEHAEHIIDDFAQWGYAELGEIMTSFIDNHGWEEEQGSGSDS